MKRIEWRSWTVTFPHKLATLRKAKGLTQKALGEEIGSSKIQIHRYETASSQPTLDAIKKLAVVLGVSTDELIFDAEERRPDDELKLQFEAISRFSPDEKRIAKELLNSLILKHETRRWSSSA